jgi:hypothetical protein
MKIIKAKKHQHKFNRRRALECTLVEKSKNNPGYLKYMVTIGEKDGSKNTQPAYGKDMQDALSRLINKERTIKVENKLTRTNPFVFFLVWLGIMGWPMALTGTDNTPWFLLYVFSGIVGLVLVGSWWYNYINKE